MCPLDIYQFVCHQEEYCVRCKEKRSSKKQTEELKIFEILYFVFFFFFFPTKFKFHIIFFVCLFCLMLKSYVKWRRWKCCRLLNLFFMFSIFHFFFSWMSFFLCYLWRGCILWLKTAGIKRMVFWIKWLENRVHTQLWFYYD